MKNFVFIVRSRMTSCDNGGFDGEAVFAPGKARFTDFSGAGLQGHINLPERPKIQGQFGLRRIDVEGKRFELFPIQKELYD